MIAIAMLVSTSAFAGNSATFDVTVSIAAAADITVTQGGPIAFGTMTTSDSSVSGNAIVIQNTGSGSNQTYSLSLVNPADWTAVTGAPGAEQYRLSAAFDSDGAGISWSDTNHPLTTDAQTATGTKFAGDQTGAGVAYNELRNLYVQLETPQATSTSDQQAISVTITAQVD